MLAFTFLFAASLFAAPPLRVCLLGSGESHPEEKAIRKIWAQAWSRSPEFTVKSVPLYDKNGSQTPALVEKAVREAQDACQILHFNWNRRFSSEWIVVVKALETAIHEGKVVVATAGVAEAGIASKALADTVMGHVERALIVGELSSASRLEAAQWSGPEMVMALKPKGAVGAGTAAAQMTARLVPVYHTHPPGIWIDSIKRAKSKAGSKWPKLDDLFK